MVNTRMEKMTAKDVINQLKLSEFEVECSLHTYRDTIYWGLGKESEIAHLKLYVSVIKYKKQLREAVETREMLLSCIGELVCSYGTNRSYKDVDELKYYANTLHNMTTTIPEFICEALVELE